MVNYGLGAIYTLREYWTSTTDVLLPKLSWTVSIVLGNVSILDKTSVIAHVVPVRGDSSTAIAAVASTLQTGCFDTDGTSIPCAGTGQDGELQKGVKPPATRFTDNSDGTMTDGLTGRMWSKDANHMKSDPGWDKDGAWDDGAVSWLHAMDYITKLNSESYLGYSDWRLPNILELQSLTQNNIDNMDALIAAGFNLDIQRGQYWTSNPYSQSYSAWVVQVFHGIQNGGQTPVWPKVEVFPVWPVRN